MLPPPLFLLLRRLNRSGNRISKQNLVSFMISQSLNSLGNKNSGQTKECFSDSEPLAQNSCVHSRQGVFPPKKICYIIITQTKNQH